MICPVCNGEKKVLVLACPGARLIDIDCLGCGGTGIVDEQRCAWEQRGAECKRQRMNPVYRDMRELSRLTGIDMVKISHMERGLEDPTPLETALAQLA